MADAYYRVRAAAGGYRIVPNHTLTVRYSDTPRQSRLGYECTRCGKRSKHRGQYEYEHCRHDLYADPEGMQKAMLELKGEA